MKIEFLLTTLIIVISPGPGVVYTLSAGLSRGAKAGIIAAFACTLGILPHMAAAVTGLAALLHTSALAFQILKYLGVAYLLYMAWSSLREKGAIQISATKESSSFGHVILSGIFLNLLNPKLSIFFFAFLPQFVDSSTPSALLHMMELSTIFMAMTFIVFVFYGWCAAMIRGYIFSRPAILIWMRRIFAGAFAALGIKLALATDR